MKIKALYNYRTVTIMQFITKGVYTFAVIYDEKGKIIVVDIEELTILEKQDGS